MPRPRVVDKERVCPCGNIIHITNVVQFVRKKYCCKKCFYKYRSRPRGLVYKLKVVNRAWYPKGHISWTAGTAKPRIDKSMGRMRFKIDGKTIHYPRLLMEKKLGRKLLEEEIVHHIDFNPLNNNLENLFLFKNSSEHMKFHWQLRKLTKLLARLI